MITQFINYQKQVRGLSPRTCDEYQKNLRYFVNWAQAYNLRWSTVTKKDIDRWTEEMSRNNQEPATIKQRISTLRCFYRWLKNEGKLTQNPAQYCQTTKMEEKLPREVDIKAIDEWLSKPARTTEEKRVNMLVALITETGLRLSEAVNIKKSDFQHAGIIVKGKGKRERIVFYGQRTINALRAYMPACDCIFEEWTPDQARWAMYRTIGKYIPRIHPHMLRHTFAMHSLNNGMSLDEVGQLLGHKNVQTTQIYARAATSTLQTHYNKIYM